MATSGQFLFSELTGHADSIDFDKAEVESSIPERFSRQAANRRNAFAAKDSEQAITYSELDALSNQIAHRLLEDYGPQPLRVGLCFSLSVDAVAAHLGVWKAGKTGVPIDPQFPSTRTAAILADANADVAIVAANQLGRIQDLDAAPDVLELNAMSRDMPKTAPDIAVAAEDPAVILYISGTAGRPTGIVHTHRSLLHRCWSDTQYFQITQRDHISLLTSPGFGAGIPQILSALLNGATLYPFDLQTRSFEELYDWLWTERITLFYPPVFAFRQFLEGCPAGERYDDCRYVIQAGAPTLGTTIESWRKHFPPTCALVCQLTSTETQVVSRYSIAHDQQLDDRYMTTGYADCDKQLAIVDSDGKPVERGAIGELVVSSKYLSAGIWSAQHGRAIAHANPTGYQNLKAVPSIHTRDLVSLDPRGRLRHHGRSDSAIKLRGYRIDVSEIEAALIKRRDIAETVCVTRELENHRRQVVAFYVPAVSANKPTDLDLRHWLRGYIPDYMLPARLLSVAELPRTINGKIARRAVENLEIVQRSRGADLHSFENELQRRFVEIWRAAIGHEDIGIDDDFFDIGGDTMTALQVSAAVSRCIGRHVPFGKIIELRNIRRLVENLDRADEPITCLSLLPGTSKRAARRPLFCIEGFYLYRQFAEALGPDRETIGVLARTGNAPVTHLLCSRSNLRSARWRVASLCRATRRHLY